MTLDEVKRATVHIFNKSDDDERAHCLEDDLYYRLLASIADGTCDDPAACAAEAITSKSIMFARWCA